MGSIATKLLCDREPSGRRVSHPLVRTADHAGSCCVARDRSSHRAGGTPPSGASRIRLLWIRWCTVVKSPIPTAVRFQPCRVDLTCCFRRLAAGASRPRIVRHRQRTVVMSIAFVWESGYRSATPHVPDRRLTPGHRCIMGHGVQRKMSFHFSAEDVIPFHSAGCHSISQQGMPFHFTAEDVTLLISRRYPSLISRQKMYPTGQQKMYPTGQQKMYPTAQ